MIQRDTTFYRLLEFGLGGVSSKNWQAFVDKFNEKYNKLDVDGFDYDPIQLDYTYEQLIVENTVATLPQYVDVDSPGLDKSFGEFVIGKDKVPTQRHGYAVDRKIIREQMLMLQKFGNSALNTDTRNALLRVLFDATDKLIQGNRNALTHQRMREVSTGKFTLDIDNSPRGLKGITFDFGVPASNITTLSGTARWWTDATHTVAKQGSASNPIEDMKAMKKAARKKYLGAMHFEISEELFDDMLGHTKVLEKIGYAIVPAAAADSAVAYAQNLDPDAQKKTLEKLVGYPIVVRDSKAAVDKFDADTKKIVPALIDNFDIHNVSLIPDGQVGTIKAVQPISMGSPSAIEAWFDGGRTLLTQSFNDREHTMYVESEMAMLAVPNRPQYIFINTVTV